MTKFIIYTTLYVLAFLALVIWVVNPWVALHTDVLWVRCLFAVVFGFIAGDLGCYVARKTTREWE